MPSSKFGLDSLPSLAGKVYIVTGGNAGIGKATVAGLASHGARVYMCSRNEAKALASIAAIQKELPDADVHFLSLDLMSLESVVAAVDTIHRHEPILHGLVNNAGIMGVPLAMTSDGFESQFQTNYLSHWLLTYLLLPLLTSTAQRASPGDVRIVNVTSDGHSRYPPKEGIRFSDINLPSEKPMARYGQSKLANILHTNQLHKRYGPKSGPSEPGEIWVASVHPGHIDTALNKQATGMAPSGVLRTLTPIMRCLGILDEQAKGAWSSLFAVASPAFDRSSSGSYIVPYAKIGTPSAVAQDDALAEKLWDWTADVLQTKRLLP